MVSASFWAFPRSFGPAWFFTAIRSGLRYAYFEWHWAEAPRKLKGLQSTGLMFKTETGFIEHSLVGRFLRGAEPAAD